MMPFDQEQIKNAQNQQLANKANQNLSKINPDAYIPTAKNAGWAFTDGKIVTDVKSPALGNNQYQFKPTITYPSGKTSMWVLVGGDAEMRALVAEVILDSDPDTSVYEETLGVAQQIMAFKNALKQGTLIGQVTISSSSTSLPCEECQKYTTNGNARLGNEDVSLIQPQNAQNDKTQQLNQAQQLAIDTVLALRFKNSSGPTIVISPLGGNNLAAMPTCNS